MWMGEHKLVPIKGILYPGYIDEFDGKIYNYLNIDL